MERLSRYREASGQLLIPRCEVPRLSGRPQHNGNSHFDILMVTLKKVHRARVRFILQL